MDNNSNPWVAVIGAGPAGMFGSFELASQGVNVALFNRDIKPGGLAEYGIYPTKYRLRNGLRAQFRQILTMQGIEYFGNVRIAENGDLTLEDLRQAGIQALLVCTGAQGTKLLGIPGENLQGVIHAKDLVYHYNQLPPFSETSLPLGKHVIIIGIGNVMIDVARWLLDNQIAQTVTAIGRRGPLEAKFDQRELASVAKFLDHSAINSELALSEPLIQSLGGNLDPFRSMINGLPDVGSACSRLRIRFLLSPKIIQGEKGNVTSLQCNKNTLIRNGSEVHARHTAEVETIPADTIIYAIGDMVDKTFGLPVSGFEFSKNPSPRFAIDDTSFEVIHPESGTIIPDVFVAGWARQVSKGQVGIAHKDGVNAARAIHGYLDTLSSTPNQIRKNLDRLFARLTKPIVHYTDLLKLEVVEKEFVDRHGLDDFKYSTNEQMLKSMGL